MVAESVFVNGEDHGTAEKLRRKVAHESPSPRVAADVGDPDSLET
jgi:hypothetical protein